MSTASIRAQVEDQLLYDRNRGDTQTALVARMRGVLEAPRAFAQREEGAGDAFRGALVDLTSLSELLAADLVDAQSEWLDLAAAARYLAVPRTRVNYLIHAGRLRSHRRPGGRVEVRRMDLDAAM